MTIEIVSEFIAPFEDNLQVAFMGDHLEEETVSEFKRYLEKSRKSLPDKLSKIKFTTMNTAELFRSKHRDALANNICIVFMDEQLSNNVIKYLTNELYDEMEGMLIDKFILQVPQEKYIFDITLVSDDTLAKLCQNMDNRNGAFNYLICENYLAVWILYEDEFNLIQDL